MKLGRHKKNGYWMLTVAPYTYQYEHRYVMEQYLGRKLESFEIVHHINRNRADNRLENLSLTTSSHNIAMSNAVRPITDRYRMSRSKLAKGFNRDENGKFKK